jgi:tRNA G18 (ribose-2'-O)-methylase SpoU
VENILESSYDEIYNEENIKEKNISYKILSDENPIILDNQKYLKISSNWKKILEPENIPKNMFNKTLNRRFDIIILASLLEKTPNLGGLVRTCEIFNIGALTIPSEDILKDKIFLESASSCEKLVPLLSIPKVTIKEFIIAYRKLGYSIVGLEQTQNSIDIKKFEFKEKMVLVLGNEKEGIPQDIIDLIDNCVIINQFGEVRSLNVHASAAIMIWECIKCLTNKKK